MLMTRALAFIFAAFAALTLHPPSLASAPNGGMAVGTLAQSGGTAFRRPAAATAVIDSSYRSPKNRGRPTRRRTEFIILHTTEGGVIGALEKLSKNGECHYVVDTTGKIYSIIDKTRVAYHAGLSMWNGQTNLDTASIGIEIVGYHDKDLTARQYTALSQLLKELKATYKVSDEKVMTHSMVAYGNPNRWQKHRHRGRKRCGMLLATNASRNKLGLYAKPAFDPDIRAGRLVDADPELTRMLYAGPAVTRRPAPQPQPPKIVRTQPQPSAPKTPAPAPTAPTTTTTTRPPQPTPTPAPPSQPDTPAPISTAKTSNIIAPGRSAWDIARDLYAAKTTVYIFPDGTEKRGNEIKDWKKELQSGTRVNVGQTEIGDENESTAEGLVEIGADGTARELAGNDANSTSTFYFKPGVERHFKKGSSLSDSEIDSLPEGTRMLIGYKNDTVSARRPVFNICGTRWNNPETYYLDPTGKIIAGDKVDEKNIPSGSIVFYKD